MCIAVVGKVIEIRGESATVDVNGNRLDVVTAVIPTVRLDDYVLVHAGFAIGIISEQDYIQHQQLLSEIENYAKASLGQ